MQPGAVNDIKVHISRCRTESDLTVHVGVFQANRELEITQCGTEPDLHSEELRWCQTARSCASVALHPLGGKVASNGACSGSSGPVELESECCVTKSGSVTVHRQVSEREVFHSVVAWWRSCHVIGRQYDLECICWLNRWDG